MPSGQQLKFLAWADATTAVWAEARSIHVFIGGELARTRTSKFTAADLKALVHRGWRIAGPEPAALALSEGPQAPLEVEVDQQLEHQ